MAKIDFGGSGAVPYFGEEGRARKTAQAREEKADSGATRDVADGNVVPTAEVRGTGVDAGPASRETDEAGREVVSPQVHNLRQDGRADNKVTKTSGDSPTNDETHSVEGVEPGADERVPDAPTDGMTQEEGESNAEFAARAAEERATREQRDNATRLTAGGNANGAVRTPDTEDEGSAVAGNAAEHGQSTRNEYEQPASDEMESEGGFFTDAEVENEEGGEGGPRPASSWK